MKPLNKIVAWFKLQTVCAWCSKHLGGNPLAPKSHGICVCCERKMRLKMVKPVCAELTEPSTPFVVK